MQKKTSTDVFGIAVEDYHSSFIKTFSKIKVFSSVSGIESIRLSYLFRSFIQMPPIEQKALELASGKILDVGACAGSHALVLQNMQKDVTALEISEKCCNVMSERGVQNIISADITNYSADQYDTLLLLMNGIGLAGNLESLPAFLNHLKKLLKPGGQIIFDSSDIDYAYYEKDGSKWVDLNNTYYGQVKYTLEYKGSRGEEFPWLFLDKEKARESAIANGFTFDVLAEGDQNNYLAALKVNNER